MNKNGQVKEINDLFKAVITGMIGVIFISTLIPVVSPSVVQNFAELGVFLIVMAIIAAIISLISKPFRRHF